VEFSHIVNERIKEINMITTGISNRLLKANEVAQILGISRSQVYKLMDSGVIPVIRFGKIVRVDPGELEAFILDHSNKLGGVNIRWERSE
jgi:excisionase family DNA binding protein